MQLFEVHAGELWDALCSGEIGSAAACSVITLNDSVEFRAQKQKECSVPCSPTAGSRAQICSFPPSASPREAQPGDLQSAERGESTRGEHQPLRF